MICRGRFVRSDSADVEEDRLCLGVSTFDLEVGKLKCDFAMDWEEDGGISTSNRARAAYGGGCSPD